MEYSNSVRPNCVFCNRAGLTGKLHHDSQFSGYTTHCEFCKELNFLSYWYQNVSKLLHTTF